MKSKNTYTLNYNKFKKIIKNYYSLQGKKVKVKIINKFITDFVFKPCVHTVVSISEKNFLAGVKQETTKILSTEELKEIINSILEKEGKELIGLTSNVAFKKVCSDESDWRYDAFNSTWLENKTFTIITEEKKLDDVHPTVMKPSEEEIVKGLEDGMSINDESGTELAKRTSEHIKEKFEITKESFYQSYVDNNGFNTTMNSSCDIDPAIEEFVEKGPVKKLTKKNNK